MEWKVELCFECGKKGKDFLGFSICDSCKSKLRLFNDKTIKKHDSPSFEKEIQRRLDFLDRDYRKKKIKLLHILERLKYIR